MQISRRYTKEGRDPFAAFTFVCRTSRIVNPDGTTVFEMKDLLAPEQWSQVAVDILSQKYFRKAGVPAKTERMAEAGIPDWLQRRPGSERRNRARKCFAGWRVAEALGLEGGYFGGGDARAFYDETCGLAANGGPQLQWFNTA